MPTKYNWNLIQSGEAFQALVNTLLQFELTDTRVFGRAGRDSGQDARSADGQIVYQCKHHSDPAFSKTISDATTERAKIEKYRKPDHSYNGHWQHAREWVLITNVLVNPNDTKRWDDEVIPQFAKIGLRASLWSLERLEALLTKYPHVANAFFEGENRCFLSVGEAYQYLRADEIGEIGLKVALHGRDAELSRIDTFLKDTKKLLWMHGPGGIGKSRLLLEVGAKAENAGCQVLWAIEATMSKSTQWFSSVNYSLPTVLLLDEPQDPALIHVITEQIKNQNSPIHTWKIIVAVRSPNDPVLRAVKELSSSIGEGPLVLDPLTPEMSKRLAVDLIENSPLAPMQAAQQEKIAEHLSRLGDRFPIWIAMAVNVLAKHGDLRKLPNDADEIAQRYVDEIIERSASRTSSQQQLQDVLRWVAIYDELDVEDSSLVSFVSKQAGLADESRFLECLNSLIARKFLVRRGVNQRLYSIKPDVVSEFVLRDWLTSKVDGNPETSPAASRLVVLMISGVGQKPLPRLKSLVKSLARTEYVTTLQGTRLDLLSPLVIEIQRIAHEGTTLDQQELLSFISCFDFARLDDAVGILRTIRLSVRPDQEYSDIFGKHQVSHNDVVSELAWPLFNAARYARTRQDCRLVLDEMLSLSKCEAGIPELTSNDGKRADALIPRMISGENYWYPGFKDAALEIAKTLLPLLKDAATIDDPTLNIIEVLCEPFLSVEREITSYQQHAFTVTKWYIKLESPDGLDRSTMRTLIREVVQEDATPEKCRLLCWKLLSSTHSSANRALLGNGKELPSEFTSEIKGDLKSDLQWALMVLRKRELGLTEIRAARNLWDWHRQFEKDEELKKLAVACDAIYQRNPLVEALDVFFSYEMYELAAKKAVELGEKMGRLGTRDGVREFLDQVIEFAPRNDFGSILRIAEEAATYWGTNAELQELVNIALTTQPVGLHYAFAITLLNRRLRILRQASNDTTLRRELQKVIQAPPNPEAKIKLLLDLYSRPHPLATGILSVTDFDFAVAETDSLKPVLKRQVMCQILAGMCHANWNRAKSILETAYYASEEENRMPCLAAIFDTIHFLDLFRADYPVLAISERTFTWLLDLVVTLPDVDEFGEYREHEMSQLVEKFGRRDLAWLCGVLEYRVQTFGPKGADESESSKIAPRRHRLTMYVRPLDPPASSDSSAVKNVGALLDYALRKDMLGYFAPQYAIDIDPKGVVVPRLIILRIESVSPKDINSVWVWARFAGYYRFNSIPWKQIAKSAVKFADGLAPRDAGKVFVELLAKEFKSSSYPAGEMDPRPEQDLNARRNELEQEKDSDLAPFRKWHLAMAQAEFDLALAQYKERNEQ